jgi:hypothetical protein
MGLFNHSLATRFLARQRSPDHSMRIIACVSRNPLDDGMDRAEREWAMRCS